MIYQDARRDMQKDLREKEDVRTGMRLLLVDLLYDKIISIEQFKDYCTENGIDYEAVEHCCGCAGCYDPEEGSSCPDFEGSECKIVEPKYCALCGQKAEIGYPMTDDDKDVFTFWVCDKHAGNKKLEKDLRKGTPVDFIIKKWNK
jgi:hypothetical protein